MSSAMWPKSCKRCLVWRYDLPMDAHALTSVEQLRDVLGYPSDMVVAKAIPEIDAHCARFIAASPFVLIGTANAAGKQDVSPKGDPAGFVRVLDAKTLLIPERLGNRRADTLCNLIENPAIGMLFLIPGVEDSLRVNGRAVVSSDPVLRAQCIEQNKTPALVTIVTVEEAFLHCAKCVKRSKLWGSTARPDGIPTLAQALVDQTKPEMSVEELQAAIDQSYATKMY
jgi:uncharacterized protein